jgi:hypothetical protein
VAYWPWAVRDDEQARMKGRCQLPQLRCRHALPGTLRQNQEQFQQHAALRFSLLPPCCVIHHGPKLLCGPSEEVFKKTFIK